MTSSPLITSALLHLAVLSLICLSGGRRTIVPPLPQVYVELTGVQAAATAEASAVQPLSVPGQPLAEPLREQEEAAAAEENDTGGAEVALPVPPEEVAQARPAPEISQAFAAASRMQEMMRKTRSYQEVAGMAVRKMLEGKLASAGVQRFEGDSAEIVANYAGEGGATFLVSTSNQQLRDLLGDEAVLSRIPDPRQWLLEYSRVAFLVSFRRGAVQVALSPR